MTRGASWAVVVGGLTLLAGHARGQLPLLSFEGLAPGDAAGAAVARLGDLDGDGEADLAVGAPGADPSGSSSGAVYVLSGADMDVLFVLAGAGPGDQFGAAVADAGDVDADGIDDIVVGAPQDPTGDVGWGGHGPGYAQVHSGAHGGLLHAWQGEHGVNTMFNSFGRVVAGAGDLDGDGHADVVVAEREGEVELLHDLDPVGGRVWVYSGLDGSVLRRIENVGPTFSHLGWSAAGGNDFDGDGVPDVLVGAPIFDGPGVVLISGASSQPLLGIESSLNMFGGSLAVLGDVDADDVPDVAVGNRHGAAVHSGATGGIQFTTLSYASNGPYESLPVAALADLDGDDVQELVLGAPAVAAKAGLVQLFSGVKGDILFTFVGGEPEGRLGSSVAGVHDVDDDGKPDVLVGAPGVAAGAGLAAIQSTHSPELHLTLHSPNPVDVDFGQRVASAGDVDNDGWGDVAVGLPYDSSLAANAGRVQVFSGRDGSLLLEAFGQVFDRLGWSLAAAGDMDADGYDDLVVGAPYPTTLTGPSYARVLSGRDGSALLQLDGHATGDQFGTGVTSPGDIDHDGVADIAVAAPGEFAGSSQFGKVYLYSGATGAELFQLKGTTASAAFGAALAGAGDLDQDGAADLLVGSPDADLNGLSSGFARAYSGASGTLLLNVVGPSPADQAGFAVAGIGDLDGDGHDDVAVGIPQATGPDGDFGVVRLVSGRDGLLLHELTSSPSDAPFGRAVAGAGDVNHDGVPDVAVGVPWADDLAGDGGGARVYSGADGVPLLSWPGTAPGNLAGWSLSARGDIDNDGSTDLVIGALGSTDDPAPAGAVYVVNFDPLDTPWSSLGGKLPGTHGAPTLTGTGALQPTTTTTLVLQQALENQPATLVLGLTVLGLPFKGGTLVPFPQSLVAGLSTGATGTVVLAAPWPAGVPSGLSVITQFWIADPAAPAGLAASNAVLASVP